MDIATQPDVLGDLTRLTTAQVLTKKAQKTAEALLLRCTAPVKVVIAGDTDGEMERVFGAVGPVSAELGCTVTNAAYTDADAITSADIVLWVTADFSQSEEAAWQVAPDHLKDHSFLVSTGQIPPEVQHRLSDCAAQDFAGLLAFGGAADADKLRDALVRQVRLGQQADRDGAAFFLQAHADALATLPAQGVDAARGVQENSPFVQAAQAIRQRTDGFRAAIATQEVDVPNIFGLCTETAEALSEIFQSADLEREEDIAFRDDVLAAADRLVLMSLENDEDAAREAVLTILQIDKELAVLSAG